MSAAAVLTISSKLSTVRRSETFSPLSPDENDEPSFVENENPLVFTLRPKEMFPMSPRPILLIFMSVSPPRLTKCHPANPSRQCAVQSTSPLIDDRHLG
jgi:hypothetical protein